MKEAVCVVAAYTALFTWLFATPLVEGSYLAESDMYEQFLPVFLSPFTVWSSYEFGGMPAFADPQDTAFYPLHFLFGRVFGSWTGFIISAFVLAACFTYAYVYSLTQSRIAAAFAGVAFGLSEAMVERLAHVTTIHAIPWLPLMLLCIDRIRGPRPTLWMAAGAVAVACCVLGGHPQVVLYFLYACGLYAVVGAIAERAAWTAYARLAAALALGVALTAVKAIPLIETTAFTARQSLEFAAFVSHSNTPAQMLSALFPAVVHEGREAPTYVGLATLIFAAAAAWRPFRHWRIAFWVAVVIVAALIGMGGATPMGQLAYDVPMYDRFRVVARHLILACFGASVLAGIGLAAVLRDDRARRRLPWAIASVASLLAAGAAALMASPQTFGLVAPGPAVLGQSIAAAATIAACAAMMRRPRSVLAAGALTIVVAADLLSAQPHPVGLAGLDTPRIPREAIQPSVHASRLAAELSPNRQRLLAPAGTQLDDVVPAAFARVWKIPIAGGYGPMLLARHNTLAMMGTNGSVDPRTLADDNSALDLLAVRFIVMSEEELAASSTFEREGIVWASQPIGVAVGPRECGQRHPRTVSYALPSADVAAIALVARLRCSEDVPQGTEVARLRVVGADGRAYERALTAGVDIAEGALADTTLLRRARHGPTRLFDGDSALFSYLLRTDLPEPLHSALLQVDVTGTPGWLDIERLTVIDTSGRSLPVEMPHVLLESGRWRETARFATSRVTDRWSDEDRHGETGRVVFENLRAQPRAWVTRRIMPLADKEMLVAVHHSLLPDGSRFEPADVALVAHGTLSARTYPDGASTAVIASARDGGFTVDVTTAGGGFLVLSESYYPGWRARIGDRTVPLYPTDVSLQGVHVPPGRHVVEFEFVSTTRHTGAAVSLVALALACVVGWRGSRRAKTTESQRQSDPFA